MISSALAWVLSACLHGDYECHATYTPTHIEFVACAPAHNWSPDSRISKKWTGVTKDGRTYQIRVIPGDNCGVEA